MGMLSDSYSHAKSTPYIRSLRSSLISILWFTGSARADSLHSGSISFGRFENEPLCWERRSSFSHNRYLEEVEKCSKPGSVVEKKAYFEAHFKRKARLLQGSSECLNEGEYQTGENDVLDNDEGSGDEFDIVIESSKYDRFEENGLENMDYREEFNNGDEVNHESVLENANRIQEFNNKNVGSQFDYVIENKQFAHFYVSPESSESHGELGVMECEGEDSSVSRTESQMGAAIENADIMVDNVPEDVDKSLLSNDEAEIELEKSLLDYAIDVDESSKPTDLFPKSGTTGEVNKSSSEHQQSLSMKSRDSAENKSTRPRMNSPVNVSHVHKHIFCEASKTGEKNLNRREKEGPGRMKVEKQSIRTATPARHSIQRSSKTEESESSAAKLKVQNKSEKEPRAKKILESQPTATKKIDSRARQTINRLKQTVDLSKPVTRAGAATFSFRSDERAERRKEFFMKLEEKMHAKEAEKNQIQAKTQEKTEAEIKQFRKSLNFKATPMPSFYHVSATPGSDGNKTVSSNTKPTKIRPKSTSPGTKGTARSPLLSKAGKDRGLSASQSSNTVDKPESSGASKCSTTELSEADTVSSSPTTKARSHHEASAKIGGATEKKGREKERNPRVQKYRVSESRKVTKDHRSETKPKVGAWRHSSEIMRKNMKGISGIGCIAVGVAS
ncbi:hypothetical protein Dsin_008707 [Dipteronia sinensis]|uniref:TPX2 C-terminal domain-containing protein n=1 Tax=Dipteronia sinensis TaxID=43782 RepID=A0AAE0AQE8_9ROSI|nr:hypothetical protein Dsin_008707 [Dipteronia sinensis]